jgi:surface antigen
MHLTARRMMSGLAAVALTAAAMTVATVGTASADTGSTIAANAKKYLNMSREQAGMPDEAWCADFLRKIWSDSGVRGAGEITGAAGSAWIYGVNHNTLSSTPAVGAAVIFNDAVGSSPTSHADHVAIVTQVNGDGSIVSIGGNEGGSTESNGRVLSDGPYQSLVLSPFWNNRDFSISGYALPDTGSVPALGSVLGSGGRLGYLRSTSPTASANGPYVSTELGYSGANQGILRARGGSVGPWEKYLIVRQPNGTVALMSTANGKFASVEFNYPDATQAVLRARSDTIGSWEEFTLVSNNGDYALRSAHQYNNVYAYVSAELGYDKGYNLYGELRARNTSIGEWERFRS